MKSFWQFVKFFFVGISNTLISEVVYVILVFLRCNYLFASFIGFVISVLNAYYWSNRYVFVKQEDEPERVWWKVLFKTYMAYIGGFVINAVLLVFWVDIFKIHRYMNTAAEFLQAYGFEQMDAELLGMLVAEAINLLLTVPINFVVNKYWTYKVTKKDSNS